jgi:hypothetical protein
VLDAFPPDAAREGDLVTGRGQTVAEYEPIHQDRWGTVYRPERVICTAVMIEDVLVKPEGEVCLLESTVKDLGGLVGMVPGEVAARLRGQLEQAESEINDLRAQLAEKSMVDTVLQRAVNDAMNEAIPKMLVGPAPPAHPATAVVQATAAKNAAALKVLDKELRRDDGPPPPPSDDELERLAKRK